ncbi:Ger(x)C family spore germination protein [Paenibacillus rigui]|uniref:Spore gernimation protein GerC n=1 Tax=Paenibacillus rigui TaxID=554312 RepID=A0A229UVY1_9BACL|nr:Ger(x)C family spore germination protein [Paenibacillus rigui]OXM87696.1 spore gernimation protein GerC [Paenibacillus rigui]
MTAKRRNKTVSVLLLVITVFPILAGCWDRMEIEERAVVLGIGIDKAKEKHTKPNEAVSHPANKDMKVLGTDIIKVTVQIAVPGRIPLGPGEGGGGGGGQKTVWVVEAVGHTVADAFNVLQQRVSRPLFFGHLRIIVVSEVVASKGIENLNDYFRRNPEVRRTNWMVICKGEAANIMHASPQLERVPTLYLMTTMDQAVKMGRFPNDFLGIFWSSVSAKGKEGYLPYMEMMENDNVQISGLALFRGDKLVSVTDPREIILYMGIMGVREGGGESYVKPKGSSDYFMFQSRTRKSTFKVSLQDGKPHINVRVIIEGNLLSKSSEAVTLNEALVRDIELQLDKIAMQSYKQLVVKTQAVSSDIFGFGEHIRAKLPKYWNEHIKTEEHWQEQYSGLKVDISVDIHVRRIGMKAT